MVCLLCDFKILLTVFNQSYNCQTSHYLGRNRLPKAFLMLPSLSKSNRQDAEFAASIKMLWNLEKSLEKDLSHCVRSPTLQSVFRHYSVRRMLLFCSSLKVRKISDFFFLVFNSSKKSMIFSPISALVSKKWSHWVQSNLAKRNFLVITNIFTNANLFTIY